MIYWKIFYDMITIVIKSRTDGMIISAKITKIRESVGWSKNRLAKEAGLSQAYISQLEAGQKQPTIDVLGRICNALDMTLMDFFTEDQEHPVLNKSAKALALEIQSLRSAQADIIKNIITEFSLINQKANKITSKKLSNDILDLFTADDEPLTLAGKPLSYEERIKILELLKDLISASCSLSNGKDDVLVASYDGDPLVYIPGPEDTEDIEKAIQTAESEREKNEKEKKNSK